MNYKNFLLLSAMSLAACSLHAQRDKVTGFAITGSAMGERGWKQVRMLDMKTGAELKAVYTEPAETEILNARTGKAIEKRDVTADPANNIVRVTVDTKNNNTNNNSNLTIYRKLPNGTITEERITSARHNFRTRFHGGYDKPFSTTSAAMAYDKKHQRLYYTPMGIAELRYIDMKAKKPTVYYFQGEAFGVVTGIRDAANQVTRMVIGADGNGYALSNNAEHLIRFTTGKKPEIADLGGITDDAANGRYSIHSTAAYGGDLVAGKSGNLYLITASRQVFKINLEEKTALHLGVIKGLPVGYSTNGAMVEEGMNIIVCSSDSPEGYFRFNLNTLQAEKYSGAEKVFNASDLAGSNLLSDKPETQKENPQPPVTVQEEAKKAVAFPEIKTEKAISVYPNPVSGNEVKLSLNNLLPGKYFAQLTDLSGKVVASAEINVTVKNQVETFRFPSLTSKGNYFVKLVDVAARNVYTEKIVVQ